MASVHGAVAALTEIADAYKSFDHKGDGTRREVSIPCPTYFPIHFRDFYRSSLSLLAPLNPLSLRREMSKSWVQSAASLLPALLERRSSCKIVPLFQIGGSWSITDCDIGAATCKRQLQLLWQVSVLSRTLQAQSKDTSQLHTFSILSHPDLRPLLIHSSRSLSMACRRYNRVSDICWVSLTTVPTSIACLRSWNACWTASAWR